MMMKQQLPTLLLLFTLGSILLWGSALGIDRSVSLLQAGALQPFLPSEHQLDPAHDLYVFVTPPASYMFQHISLVLELWKRQLGNVLVLTLKGYEKAFLDQAALLAEQSTEKPRRPDTLVWSMGEIPLFPYFLSHHRKTPAPLEIAEFNRFGMPVPPFREGLRNMDSYAELFSAIQDSFEAALLEQDPLLHLQELCERAKQSSSAGGPVKFAQIPQNCEVDDSGQAPNGGLYGEQVRAVVSLLNASPRKLFVIPGFYPSIIAFCEKLRLPYVSTIPTAVWADLLRTRWLAPYHHSVEARDGFFERAIDALRSLYMKFFMHDNPMGLPLQVPGARPLQLILSHPFLATAGDLPPAVVFTGAVVAEEREDPSLISPESQSILDSGLPVVYVSFGTHAVLDDETFETVAKGLLPDLEQPESGWAVIWNLADRQKNLLSEEVRALYTTPVAGRISYEKWTMTPALLAHPAVKIFASHCGGNSLGEALRAGKVILGLPATAEQPWNCAVAQRNMPELVTCHSLRKTSSEALRTNIERVLLDPSSEALQAAERMKIMSERIYSGAPIAIDWLRYAIAGRQRHTAPLETRNERLGLLRANYVDVVLLALAVLTLGVAAAAFRTGRLVERLAKRKLQ